MKTPARQSTAFTLVELLLVLATLALLAVMLLPALARSSSQPKSAACAANFRQWAVSANLYANDHQDRLPSFDPYNSGGYAWDAGTNMCNSLGSYGMTVPVWFCPYRPNEWDEVNPWAKLHLGHPIQSINDLSLYFAGIYAGELILHDNYWVPRLENGLQSQSFPIDWSTRPKPVQPLYIQQGMPTCATYGWPTKLHDNAVAHVPFVSDAAASGNSGGLNSTVVGPNVTNVAPNTAHFVNGILVGVNAAYADGHVESHSPSQMRAAYGNFNAPNFWFY